MAHLTIDFFSNCLRRTVQFQMIIPGDFCNTWQIEQKRKGKRMKTLFLLHGYTGAAENWVPDNLSTLYNFAIVMPSGENGFWVDGPATGHQYGAFIGEELPEYIRKTFGLAMNPEETYIMGLSMGGFGALHTALQYPETFGKVAALSSALIIHEIAHMQPGGSNEVANYEYYHGCFGDLDRIEISRYNPEVLVEEILNEQRKMPDIYMACGTEDFLLEKNREFHRFLDKYEVPHCYMESKGEHNMEFWTEYAGIFIPKMLEEQEER